MFFFFTKFTITLHGVKSMVCNPMRKNKRKKKSTPALLIGRSRLEIIGNTRTVILVKIATEKKGIGLDFYLSKVKHKNFF